MEVQSSSSSSNGQEQKEKKFKSIDMSKEGEDEGQVEVKQVCYFDDLPPEMLAKILKKLGVSSLLSCRLVNRRFNDLSCELLKSQVRIKVEPHLFCTKRVLGGKIKMFDKFVDCYKKSQNFPCSRYDFELCYGLGDSKDLKSFISCFKNTVKSLNLDLSNSGSFKDLKDTINYVKNSLLNNLPNLEEFGLILDHFSIASHYNLIPRATGQVKSFQLNKLKILHLSPLIIDNFPNLVKDVLAAAVNLKKIVKDPDSNLFPQIDHFKFLYSLGKLDLLQEAEILPSVELFSWMKSSMKQGTPVIFKLAKLMLVSYSANEKPLTLSETKIFINQLFDSCKDTLTELRPMDFDMDSLQLPKFTKLRKLTYGTSRSKDSDRTIKILKAETFPVLHELTLILQYENERQSNRQYFPVEDPTSVIPSIKIVSMGDFFQVNTNFIQQLAIICPNLIELRVFGTLKNFPAVGPTIWTHMTELAALILWIDVDSKENSLASIVSTFTGISKENSQLLLDQFKKIDENPMPKSKKLQAKQNLKISESEMEKLRENASILNLKALKKISVFLHSPYLSSLDTESCIQICKIHAFDYIPNLVVYTEG